MSSARTADELSDLAVREAHYSTLTGELFAAISRLDRELLQRKKERILAGERDRYSEADLEVLIKHISIEIAYRMHQRDGVRLIDTIMTISNDKERNLLLYRLANLYLQKDQPQKAQAVLDRVNGEILPELKGALAFTRAQVLMANGKLDAAIPILDELRKSQSFIGFAGYNRQAQSLLGFADYNLGIAYLLNGNIEEGRQQLDLAGQIVSEEELTRSLRDRANLMLGDQLLTDGLYAEAGQVLDRARLKGPFSAQALLSAGWSAAMQADYEQALVPWTLLSERNVTDAAVQEAMLAVPYSYGKLGVYSKAALLYGQAVESFENEIVKLKDSLASVGQGGFLKNISRKELRRQENWVVKLREQPDMPETYYLLDLMATDEFQQALDNYVDLAHLQEKLIRWQQDIQAYEGLIKKRRAYYKPILPGIDAEFRKLESRMQLRLKQRNQIAQQLIAIKNSPRPDVLATAGERELLGEIDRIDRALRPYHTIKTRARVDRLRGLVVWSIYKNYDQRLQATTSNFKRLDEVVAILEKQYNSYLLYRKAATRSYSGYGRSIEDVRSRIDNALKETIPVLNHQGELLESMVTAELNKRLEKLEQMQIKARFAMADSYDRATRSRNNAGGIR
ncbi:MAG: hypothetical protein C0623_00875 [Desulfuromonas sp.]|nr:MAG: hypothetical protein C0623_00875 [Desulfuromonas sp.]